MSMGGWLVLGVALGLALLERPPGIQANVDLEESELDNAVARALDELIHNALTEEGKYGDEKAANEWLDKYNNEARAIVNAEELTIWNYLTNVTEENAQLMVDAQVNSTAWSKKQVEEAKLYDERSSLYQNETTKRLLKLIVNSCADPKSPAEVKALAKVKSDLQSIYASAKVGGLPLEPDIERIMSKSRNASELLWAWKGWRDATGPLMRDKFTKYVKLSNKGATDNGLADMGEHWRVENYEEDNISEMADKLWTQVEPLYKQLHAYVRRQLINRYKDQLDISETDPIPAHLLGNMWAQQWTEILDLVTPYPNEPTFDITQEMKNQNYTALKMFKVAEEFFTSLGLDEMTNKFWNLSMIVRPAGREVECHASAEDFYTNETNPNNDDFRIKMCTEVNMDSLQTIHHEMGHIQYFMQYRHQPVPFREGGNSGFHEAVGDTMALSATTPDHLAKIGLLNLSQAGDKEQKRINRMRRDINYLMKMALEKIAFLPFGLLIDKYRWMVFNGEITKENYNQAWWDLRTQYQGIEPPCPRSEDDFDPGAKYHVAADVPYIRYFFSFIGQFQFHKTLCEAAGHRHNFHRCDIYKNKNAGKKLADMLSLGRSQPWPKTLQEFTGSPSFDAGALVEYFAPLSQWLEEENKGHHVGW